MKNNILAKSTQKPTNANRFGDDWNIEASINGKLYPPKYKDEISADETNIFTYSENINIPNFIELYSV